MSFESKIGNIPPEFAVTWQDKSRRQLVAESCSTINETQKTPDPYYFVLNSQDELVSPDANRTVKSVIKTNNAVGVAELRAIESVEDWMRNNNEGVSVWVSPASSDIYPDLKIVVMEIQKVGNIKKVFNRAIIFDFDKDKSLNFVNKLAQVSNNYANISDVESVRAKPFILNSASSDWISVLEQIAPDPKLWNDIRSGEDIREHQRRLSQVEQVYKDVLGKNQLVDKISIQAAMQRFNELGMIGNYRLSCPKAFMENGPINGLPNTETGFQYFFNRAPVYASSGVLQNNAEEKYDFDIRAECRLCAEKGDHSEKWVGPCQICEPHDQELKRNS